MPAKKYRVTLTKNEKALLNEIINKGKHSAEKRKRAQALRLAANVNKLREQGGKSR